MTLHVETIEENAKFLTPKEIGQANVGKQLLHGLSFSGQPQDHHLNECDSGQSHYQVQNKTDGTSLWA